MSIKRREGMKETEEKARIEEKALYTTTFCIHAAARMEFCGIVLSLVHLGKGLYTKDWLI